MSGLTQRMRRFMETLRAYVANEEPQLLGNPESALELALAKASAAGPFAPQGIYDLD